MYVRISLAFKPRGYQSVARQKKRETTQIDTMCVLGGGVACILLPVIVPVFIVLKWPQTKKGTVVLAIGAMLFGGNYVITRRQANHAITQIEITKITRCRLTFSIVSKDVCMTRAGV